MSSLFKQLRTSAPLQVLVVAVGAGLGGAFFTMGHFLRNDPTFVLVNKTQNPYPWLNMDQRKSIKFYAVNSRENYEPKGFRG